MAGQKRFINFKLYLFKRNINSIGDVFDADSADVQINVVQNQDMTIKAFFFQGDETQPNWIKDLEILIDTSNQTISQKFSNSGKKLESASTSCVLYIEYRGRVYALSYGPSGWRKISNEAVDDFGIKVVLNSLSVNSIKKIISETKEGNRVYISRKTQDKVNISDLGFIPRKEFLTGVGGVPNDPSLAKYIEGVKGLQVRVSVEDFVLTEFIKKVEKIYLCKDYLKNFSFYDEAMEAVDPSIVGKLNEIFFDRLIKKQGKFYVTNIFSEGKPSSITIFNSNGENKEYLPDDWSFEVVSELIDENFISEEVKLDYATVAYEGSSLTLKKVPLELFTTTIELDDRVYSLIEGNWSKVRDGFIEDLDSELATSLSFGEDLENYDPIYHVDSKGNQSEGQYNIDMGSREGYSYLDKECIEGVEIADIVSNIRKPRFYHVKKGTGISSVSYVTAQALDSTQLFVTSEKYRTQILNEISHEIEPAFETAAEDKQFGVDLVLIRKTAFEDLSDFSLPAKLTLRDYIRDMRDGLRVTDIRIQSIRHMTELESQEAARKRSEHAAVEAARAKQIADKKKDERIIQNKS